MLCINKDKNKSNLSKGFALPTVLVASIVMTIVLLASVSSIVAVSSSIKLQYYNQIAQTAANAGSEFAKACLNNNLGIPQWSDASPLRPGTDCSGNYLVGCDDVNNSCHWVIKDNENKIRSSYLVGCSGTECVTNVSASDVSSIGKIEILRSSDNTVWREYTKSARINQGVGFKQISAGYQHTCALDYSGGVFCWGLNNVGQVGNGTRGVIATEPTRILQGEIPPDQVVVHITAGSRISCAITNKGDAYCWGAYPGNGSNYSVTPVKVDFGPGVKIKSISSSYFSTCASSTDGLAYCWGLDTSNVIGNGIDYGEDEPIFRKPEQVDISALAGKKVKSISTGFESSCVLTEGNDANVYCWGDAIELGINDGISYTKPTIPIKTNDGSNPLLPSVPIKNLEEGLFGGTCVVDKNNKLFCWGELGKWGYIPTPPENGDLYVDKDGNPTTIIDFGNGKSPIGVGYEHVCAITSDNNVHCYGGNVNGQLGDGTLIDRYSFLKVELNTPDPEAISVSGGVDHTCVTTAGKVTYCFGANLAGQLGDGTIDSPKTSAQKIFSLFTDY